MGRRFAAAVAPWVVVAGAALACGGPAKEGGAGADCFRVSDCQAELVCIDHKCTNDLSSIVLHEDGGAAATGAAVGAGGAMGGGAGTGGAGGTASSGGAGGTASSGGAGGTASPGGAAGQPVGDAAVD